MTLRRECVALDDRSSRAFGRRVVRPPDHAHSALADLLDQAVVQNGVSGSEQRVNLRFCSWKLRQPDVRFRLRSGEVDPVVVRRHLEPVADAARGRQQLVSFAGRTVDEE